MRAHILIGFLLSCIAAAQAVSDDVWLESGVQLTAMELELFRKGDGMWVYDDDENLVKVTVDDTDDETMEETKSKLNSSVMFLLHRKENALNPTRLYVGNENLLLNSNFDPKKPTRLVTHGWINSRRSAACKLIRDAYIAHGDYNVIVVDWSRISFKPYTWASNRVKMVGLLVASMVDFLEKNGMNVADTTLVGHSLGAHVMGIAAHYTKNKVNYVVGLDPAQPGFVLAGRGFRISSGDANHVEIIHTNAGLLGFLPAIGDSDFYPNGGTWQLGCIVDIGGACSHARSYQFFAESINSNKGFYAKPCKNFLTYTLGLCRRKPDFLMGEHKNVFQAKGSHFLTTHARYPYAVGK